ncbi:uncharacterized protein LAJ45_03278 [Morchella importuna]|nr:uncharacterized protein LAJ45_03278 [Morchella importuna]KAH8152438.1 hypothetical protein LAJ45_03278 [Morchella importuna]
MARDNPELLVNCCFPGQVETETGVKFGSRAIPLKTIEEGARIPVRLAAEDIGGISGKFWKNSSLREKVMNRLLIGVMRIVGRWRT